MSLILWHKTGAQLSELHRSTLDLDSKFALRDVCGAGICVKIVSGWQRMTMIRRQGLLSGGTTIMFRLIGFGSARHLGFWARNSSSGWCRSARDQVNSTFRSAVIRCFFTGIPLKERNRPAPRTATSPTPRGELTARLENLALSNQNCRENDTLKGDMIRVLGCFWTIKSPRPLG